MVAIAIAIAATMLALALGMPAAADAHGLGGRTDLPIPNWLFAWAAALVLVASFAGLAVLWPTPQLERDRFRALPDLFSRVLLSRAVEGVCGAIGIALLLLVVWSGLAGSEIVSFNWTPTFIYVVFWLGLVPLSVFFGDVFRAFNPWRAVGRLVGASFARSAPEPLPYPAWLGRWPAAVGLLAFAWIELVSASGDQPGSLAVATLIYSVITWFAMALYGVESWIARGEAFSVYFNLYSRLSIIERRENQLGLRPPLSGVTRLQPMPGTVATLCVMIGSVSFDGLSAGPTWQKWLNPALDFLRDSLGMSPRSALELSYAFGLLLAPWLIYGLFRLGIEGARSVDPSKTAAELADAFIASFIPIALAYAAAHYVSLLVFQGQAAVQLASDPLGRDWDLFGTASWQINYSVIGANTFWYIQVAFVLAGHVAALILAHDRALVLYDDPRRATRSQYWMLAVMVAFTTLALWLLSEANKG